MDFGLGALSKLKLLQHQLPSLSLDPLLEQQLQIERQNQVNLSYFDAYFNEKTYGPDEKMLVGRDVYYQNVVIFIQRMQNLVTFKGVALVWANIPISLLDYVLKCYTFQLDDQECKILNKDTIIDNWTFTLF